MCSSTRSGFYMFNRHKDNFHNYDNVERVGVIRLLLGFFGSFLPHVNVPGIILPLPSRRTSSHML